MSAYPDHAPFRNGLERDSHDGCDIFREQREGLRPPIRQKGRPAPQYDPRIDYPERFGDGRPI